MQKVLVFANDLRFFSEVEEWLKSCEDVEISLFQHSLELIYYFLTHFSPLVILDVDILGREILELIQILKNIRTDLKIILVLSPENMPVCSAALSQGVLSYQIKPLSTKNVSEIIRSILCAGLNH